MFRPLRSLGLLLGLLFGLSLPFAALPASAQVPLPNGMVVPVDSANGEIQLNTFFSGRGEAIDWVNDALNEPDTFSPLCDFTATLVLKQSGSSIGVGWYNVVPGAVEAPTDIYEIVPAGAAVGTSVTGTSIRDDPNYLGGEIGFALIRTPPHYTQRRWNTLCNAGPCAATPGYWTLSLTYLSTVEEDAFYVAFEDGNTSSSSWDNDGDYNDYVFLFTGITCSGAGETSEIEGAEGVCRTGLTECAAAGELRCRQVNPASDEACDGVDNDCDGVVDEGDAEEICGVRQVCSRGQCVGNCEFEFGCSDSTDVCEDGYCVDAECVGVTCGEGQACVDGDCLAPCDGVVCPGDQVCRVGACVEACAGVSCDGDRVCEGGVCVDSCACRGCADGLECGGAGLCVDEGCGALSCATGVCREGACVEDLCADASCPRGQVCTDGACVAVMSEEEDAGIWLDAGHDGGLDAGELPDATSTTDSGAGAAREDGGCSCRAATPAEGAGGGLFVVLLGLGLRRRRE